MMRLGICLERYPAYLLVICLFFIVGFYIHNSYEDRLKIYQNLDLEKSKNYYNNSKLKAFQESRLLFSEVFSDYAFKKALKSASASPTLESSHGELLYSLASPVLFSTESSLKSLRFYTDKLNSILVLNRDDGEYIEPTKERFLDVDERDFFIDRDGEFHYVERVFFQGTFVGFVEFVIDSKDVLNPSRDVFGGDILLLFDSKFLDPRSKLDSGCVGVLEGAYCYKDGRSENSRIYGDYIAFIEEDSDLQNAIKMSLEQCKYSKELSKNICITPQHKVHGYEGYMVSINKLLAYREIYNDYIYRSLSSAIFFVMILYLFYKTEIARAKTHRFGKILEKSNHEIFVCDGEDFKFILANEKSCKKLKLKKEELLRRDLFSIAPDLSREELTRKIESKKSGELIIIFTYFKDSKGGGYDVRLSIQKLKENDKEILLLNAQDISEKLLLEKEISNQSLFLEKVLDAIPAPIYVKDSKSRYLVANKETRDVLGVKSFSEIVGRSDFELDLKPEIANRFFEQDRYVLDKKEELIIDSEFVFHHLLNQNIIYKTVKIPLLDLKYPREENMLLGISIDITKNEFLKKEIERVNEELFELANLETQKREQSELRYKELFENIIDAIVVLEYDKKKECYALSEINRAACDIFGKTREEIINSPCEISSLLEPVDEKESIISLFKERENPSTTYKIKANDIEVPIKITTHSYFEHDRYLTILSIEDISEKSLLKQEKIEQRKLFETLFKKAGSGICFLDRDGFIIKANRGFSSMIGHKSKDLNGEKFFDYLEKGSKEGAMQAHENHFANEIDLQSEYTLESKNGEKVVVFGSSVIIKNEKGEKYRLLILEDISKLKKLEQKQKEQERLMLQQAKMAEMGDMIGAIAHQWRQPLNSINAAAMKIRFSYELGSLDAKIVDDSSIFIENQCLKMSDTINDFMNFFKPSKEKENFNLKEIFEKIDTMLGAQLKNRNISFELNIEEDITIYGYKNELEHVFLNIIANARDAFESKNIEGAYIKVESSLFRDEELVEIKVEDNAGGIPADVIDKIFNPYFSTKETNKGTGIGLYMSKTIIDKSFGGSLRAENEDEGAMFIVEIPMSKKEN